VSTIKPYGPERLEELLTALGWTTFRSADGRAYLSLHPSDSPVNEIRAIWAAEGHDRSVHDIRVTSPSCTYPAGESPALLALVNEFHNERRWPKAYLRPIANSRVQLVAEMQYPLADGVHDELLETLTRLALATANDLFGWVSERYRPPAPSELDIDELELRLRRAS